jgi:hypothetical protein
MQGPRSFGNAFNKSKKPHKVMKVKEGLLGRWEGNENRRE